MPHTVLKNLAGMVPLDIQDSKTGTHQYNDGIHLNAYASVELKRPNANIPRAIKVSLSGSCAGRRERNYKLDHNGGISKRFWESLREHTELQLTIVKEREDRKKVIKAARSKIDAVVEVFSKHNVKADEYYLRQVHSGDDDDFSVGGYHNIQASFAVDPNGDIYMKDIKVNKRYLTLDQLDTLLTLIGDVEDQHKLVKKPVSKFGGLFAGLT